MIEASRNLSLFPLQRFWQLEMPYSAIGWFGTPSSPSPEDGLP